jgi:hypothetical protein
MSQVAFFSADRQKFISGETAVGDNFDGSPKDRIDNAYDLNSDVFETIPLSDTETVGKLKSGLTNLSDAIKANQRGIGNDVEVSDSTVESLRSLGYLK